ncbi:MAG: succinate dehydrogenase assembly factor 2 [Xanthobacteraceae bacterium]
MAEADPIDELELRRRKLRFRAWHRGTREMDFVLGRFADAELAGLTVSEIAQLEALMDAPDPDLFAWVVGQAAVPANQDTPVFRRLVEFHRAGRGAVA